MFSVRLLLKAGTRERGHKLCHSEVREDGGRLSRRQEHERGFEEKACGGPAKRALK